VLIGSSVLDDEPMPGAADGACVASAPAGRLRSANAHDGVGAATDAQGCAAGYARATERTSMYWNAFSTDQAGLGLTAELTTISGGNGDEIHAWIARPTGPGPHPGIVVLHHMPGFDEFTFEFCQRLAFHGYITVAPNLYDRYGQGSPSDVAAAVRADGGVSDESVVADGAASLEWLRAQPDFNGRAGVTGPCSGGRHALLVGTVVPGFAAIADLWGGGAVPGKENDKRPVAPVSITDQLQIPLLGIFGNEDKSPTPDDVDLHEQELKKHDKQYEFHRWDGAGHGFMYYDRPMYRQEQAMEAWEKILAFFDTTLNA
jgi:carboxymethylenebutenolidase